MNYIYEVYKEHSFSKAAQNLYISQSSLSLTIKRAEEKIGMQIFDRSVYPIQLTEFGQHYINAVKEIRSITNNLTDYIYDVNHLKTGQLSIGAGNFFSTYLVAPAISRFKKQYPNISVQLLEGRTFDLKHQLANGNIDILVTNGHLDPSIFKNILLFRERMVLVVPKSLMPELVCQESLLTFEELSGNTPIRKPGVSLKHFEHLPFIGMRPGNDSRIRSDSMFADADAEPNWMVELDQSSTAYRLACDGMGYSIVTDSVITQLALPETVYFYHIDHPKAFRDVCIYMRNIEYMPRTMEAFIRVLREPYQDIR